MPHSTPLDVPFSGTCNPSNKLPNLKSVELKFVCRTVWEKDKRIVRRKLVVYCNCNRNCYWPSSEWSQFSSTLISTSTVVNLAYLDWMKSLFGSTFVVWIGCGFWVVNLPTLPPIKQLNVLSPMSRTLQRNPRLFRDRFAILSFLSFPFLSLSFPSPTSQRRTTLLLDQDL